MSARRIERIASATLHIGDCLDVLPRLAAEGLRAHCCVTDPPYHLIQGGLHLRTMTRNGAGHENPKRQPGTGHVGFMGAKWDGGDVAFRPETWRAVYDCLLPGAHLVAFGGTRTSHRMACAIEDAGFEIRDTLCWLYGSGFPKSLDVSKAIDRARNDSPDVLRVTTFLADAADRRGILRVAVDAHMGTSDMGGWWLSRLVHRCQCPQWDQWLRLKAFLDLTDDMDAEVWRLNGRKGQPGDAWNEREVIGQATKGSSPLPGNHDGTWADGQRDGDYDITAPATPEAAQWNGWGTSLKPSYEPVILARRPLDGTVAANTLRHGCGGLNVDACRVVGWSDADLRNMAVSSRGQCAGKGHVGEFGFQGQDALPANPAGRWPANVVLSDDPEVEAAFAAFGERAAGRFPKNSGGIGTDTGIYNKSCIGRDQVERTMDSGSASRFFFSSKANKSDRAGSLHPTVKPTDLMRWLVQLVCPPNGLVLDPFAGTGSTGLAADQLGMRSVLIERDPTYAGDALRKIREDAPLFAEPAGPVPDLDAAYQRMTGDLFAEIEP